MDCQTALGALDCVHVTPLLVVIYMLAPPTAICVPSAEQAMEENAAPGARPGLLHETPLLLESQISPPPSAARCVPSADEAMDPQLKSSALVSVQFVPAAP